MTIYTIFSAFIADILEVTAAFVSQEVQRTVAEQAVEIIYIRHRMAREVFALAVAEKLVAIFHLNRPFCVSMR